MAAMGLSAEHAECSANIPEMDIDKITYAENETDVLVVGGGMAGLFAAVKAHDAGSKVTLVSKGCLGSSGQTPFAKGIFAFDPSSTKISLDEEKIHVFRSKSVILYTGAGGFKPNGFPICDLTHDGTIMAYNIGAKVTGKEWNDGHPGQAKNAAACFDGWHGMFERKNWNAWINIYEGSDGLMKLEKQSFGSWPS